MQNSLESAISNNLSNHQGIVRQPLLPITSSKNYQGFGQNNYQSLCTIRRKISTLKNDIMAKQKHKMTDLDAFYWDNSLNKKVPLLEAFKLINIPKKNQILRFEKVTKQNLNDINFPILCYTGQELSHFSVKLLECCQYMPENLNLQKIRKLVDTIALNYNIVSYHNFSHAFSLALMFNQCIQKDSKIKSILTKQQRFFGILAALAHDIKHPGTNNNFQIKMKSPLAEKYQNQSVLENMHINTLWDLIHQHPQLSPFQVNQSKNRIFVTRMILATDISKHFKNLKKLTQKSKECLNFDDQEQKYMVIQQLFHACDIGNPCIDFQGYMNWAALVTHEFDQQFKLEKKYIDNFAQPTSILQFKGINNFYQGQKGFSNALVLPLWIQIVEIFPGLVFATENIRNNLKQLEEKIEQTKA